MDVNFILGPAGSGKTFGCLAEIREVLKVAPDGPPLLLISPKQTTYQLERQLMSGGAVTGYTRLQIVSFERLGRFLFEQLGKPTPALLGEEGRLMVLRSLLARKRDELKLFRASARLTGFAQHLSEVLRELQRHRLTPEALLSLSQFVNLPEGLSLKLQDLAALAKAYAGWLSDHDLQDADIWLDKTAEAMNRAPEEFRFGGIWVDGFTDFSPQELELLRVLLPHSDAASVTFCLDREPDRANQRSSNWSVAQAAYRACREVISGIPGATLKVRLVPRMPARSRFLGNPVFFHLERHWSDPVAFTEGPEDPRLPETKTGSAAAAVAKAIRLASCQSPEMEAVLAAREILRFVRAGGRFREVTVLSRDLGAYHDLIEKVFARYEIPIFLDQRKSVSHHPLAELTRNSLRTVALHWKLDDWFAALKTGLVTAAEADIDKLENQALARGWRGSVWQEAGRLVVEGEPEGWFEEVRGKIVPPFLKLAQSLGADRQRPSGTRLVLALRTLWAELEVEKTLTAWSQEQAGQIHRTVFEQMNSWLDNVELAFKEETMSLREWLPILDAGLASLTVGVIPPALDQVMVGAIDRSRNPDIKLAIVLGMNEGVFPAPPKRSVLLTESDRAELANRGLRVGGSLRHQIGLEQYLGYLVCTRARQRLVLTYCLADEAGKPLNPSPFLATLKKLFPTLEARPFVRVLDWWKSEHISELSSPLLRFQRKGGEDLPTAPANLVRLAEPGLKSLSALPSLKSLKTRLRLLGTGFGQESLSPTLARRLYGQNLRTSVSRMEQFAACPFRFFVHSGMRAEERKLFELEAREKGNFQHDVLAAFHDELKREGKRWRDLTPAEARSRIGTIAARMAVTFQEGLLHSSERNRFTAGVLTESLQNFVETLVGWMRGQYRFDPVEVELPFGEEKEGGPPWKLDLGEGHQLWLRGRIDRVDVLRSGQNGICVVVDYKSSQKKLEAVLMENGLQLQLAAYLNVLRHWPDPKARFGVDRLIPGGVFYVNLKGKFKGAQHRNAVLSAIEETRRLAYQHVGRFDAAILDELDSRPGQERGDQFNYRRKKDGGLSANSREAMATSEFIALLEQVEDSLRDMGRKVYAGVTTVDPYRKGSATACEFCEYQSICRIDFWSHSFRILRAAKKEVVVDAVEGSEPAAEQV